MAYRKSKLTDEQKLKRIYYNPKHSASFSSRARLAKAAGVSRKKATQWLLGEEVYTTHAPARQNSKNVGFYNIYRPNQLWEVDISDLSMLIEANYPYRYMLVVIDVHSKQAQARALKFKNSVEASKAFKDILDESQVSPKMVQADAGGEFLGRPFQNLLKKYNILFRVAANKHKASVVERVQRTLKSKLYKVMAWKETEKWTDLIPLIVHSYNNTPHSALGKLAPNQVDEKNSYAVWENNYLTRMRERALFATPKFFKNDFVRVSKHKKTFEKGYTQSFSTEVYKIRDVVKKNGVFMYELQSLVGDILRGLFYTHEIQRVYYTPESTFKIEKILDRRKREGGELEYFVKWKNWHASHNSWIPASWMTSVHGR